MMQMTQFVTMMSQAAYDMATGGGGYPKFPTQILFYYMITLLILFLNFFMKDRQARQSRAKKEKAHSKSE